jgi:predicted nucleotidyltransferase
LIEWLDSPIVYRADKRFLDRLKAALPAFHRSDRAFHHYLHMAARNFRQYIEGRELVRIKKYLYVLRPVLAADWIEQGRGPAPMRFQALVDSIVTEPSLKAAIEDLLVRKRAGLESEREPPIPEISSFLEHEFARLQSAPIAKSPVLDPTPLDAIMVEAIRNWGPVLP